MIRFPKVFTRVRRDPSKSEETEKTSKGGRSLKCEPAEPCQNGTFTSGLFATSEKQGVRHYPEAISTPSDSRLVVTFENAGPEMLAVILRAGKSIKETHAVFKGERLSLVIEPEWFADGQRPEIVLRGKTFAVIPIRGD